MRREGKKTEESELQAFNGTTANYLMEMLQ